MLSSSGGCQGIPDGSVHRANSLMKRHGVKLAHIRCLQIPVSYVGQDLRGVRLSLPPEIRGADCGGT